MTIFVCQRLYFKIRLLIYKCLHQLVAVYLPSMLTPVTAIATRRHLRFANAGDLAITRTRTVGEVSRLLAHRSLKHVNDYISSAS